jgi:hypothetical protein
MGWRLSISSRGHHNGGCRARGRHKRGEAKAIHGSGHVYVCENRRDIVIELIAEYAGFVSGGELYNRPPGSSSTTITTFAFTANPRPFAGTQTMRPRLRSRRNGNYLASVSSLTLSGVGDIVLRRKPAGCEPRDGAPAGTLPQHRGDARSLIDAHPKRGDH